MQAFQALSHGDKWRVSRLLARGKTPDDPLLAAAAVELAESYQRRHRTYMAAMRWLPIIMLVGLSYVTIPAAIEGDQLKAILYVLIVLCGVGHFMFNPATRPKNMIRSQEAAKQIIAADD